MQAVGPSGSGRRSARVWAADSLPEITGRWTYSFGDRDFPRIIASDEGGIWIVQHPMATTSMHFDASGATVGRTVGDLSVNGAVPTRDGSLLVDTYERPTELVRLAPDGSESWAVDLGGAISAFTPGLDPTGVLYLGVGTGVMAVQTDSLPPAEPNCAVLLDCNARRDGAVRLWER